MLSIRPLKGNCKDKYRFGTSVSEGRSHLSCNFTESKGTLLLGVTRITKNHTNNTVGPFLQSTGCTQVYMPMEGSPHWVSGTEKLMLDVLPYVTL